jgi:predicted TIM-barrel fold metal-dependent hydrolase
MTLIDVHAHFLTPEYVAAAQRAGHHVPDGMPAWPDWSAQRHLELMDRQGIDRANLSVSSPGVHFGDDFRARVLARRMNDTAAGLVADHRGRFGFFASLPLPDLDGALAEVAHAFDELHADGVVLPTNAAGRYPGDPRWDGMWQELETRAAIVFVHPTSPPNWRDVALDRPRPMIEFLFDGARAVTDLILTGIVLRHPRIRFVITYAGGVLPMLSDRLDHFRRTFAIGPDDLPTAAEQLREFWYDVAGHRHPPPDPRPAGGRGDGPGPLRQRVLLHHTRGSGPADQPP